MVGVKAARAAKTVRTVDLKNMLKEWTVGVLDPGLSETGKISRYLYYSSLLSNFPLLRSFSSSPLVVEKFPRAMHEAGNKNQHHVNAVAVHERVPFNNAG